MLELDKVTRADFDACLNETFVLSEGEQSFPLKLVEVRSAGEGRPGRREPFALRFQADPRLRAPQRIYRLTHERLGTMEIFIVQVSAEPTGSYFEAIFT